MVRRGTVLSDDDVREILLSGDSVSTADLARRLGVTHQNIARIRKRDTKRALRIAAELGLLKPPSHRVVWSGRSTAATKKSPTARVATFAGGQLRWHGRRSLLAIA